MIDTFPKFLDKYPALGRVEVECGCRRRPDLSTILACDRAEEVGEMSQATHVCLSCGAGLQKITEQPSYGFHYGTCKKSKVNPVTARLFLWTGEPVEWLDVVRHWQCERCGFQLADSSLDLESPPCECGRESRWFVANGTVTAVVLVGGPCGLCEDFEPPSHDESCPECGGEGFYANRAAARACEAAGVQFVIPGDGEKGRVRL